ncbi:purine-binding chemotaxis protein CheW [Pseudomonas sp. JM0905a]|uniref:Chemotaxis protein CheW n=1 Tax=Metapseudomonas resinovorans TaxID=53412 RepID=A0ABT4Y166_METRE|nr:MULTISPECIES: chemotaxis protein CheW [Pseudomonas]MBD2838112.1 purine-binding chemotaxis protein CheW [Pseudomonas sp. JM0905a]MDA8482395.1 chemotaxis protein CheW [Pseudomonas resinovorans]
MGPSRSLAPARTVRGRLYLQFRMGGDRYALDVHEVVEVLPLRQLKQVPEAPEWVAGVFSHRGALVPVLDLGILAFGQPAQARTSTRLVLVNYPLEGQSRWLGLILEQATDTLRCHPEEFRDYGLEQGGARYLGPVYQAADGLVQRIRVADLLPDEVRALLFPATEGAA